ncbi:MAG: NAD(P)/FAD-dependent oxidoreductase [Candidatus Schekmanbacteria bacterium]|nr:MAG: NAD(P)/FAD-dependent oxidoreductase [Candidatus Schekmanbacteria bacterium]
MNERLALDVAVIGAGPCGLMTAKKLAEKGFKVAVFDRKPYASFINPGIMEMLSLQPNKIEEDSNNIYFTESGFSLSKRHIKNKIYGFATYSPGKYALVLRSIYPTNYRIDYKAWIEKLENEAKEKGVVINYEKEMTGFISSGGYIKGFVIEDKKGNDSEVYARHIVAADGIRSKLSAYANIERELWGVHRIVGVRLKDFDIKKTGKDELFDPNFHNMYLNKKFSGPNTLAITAYLGDGEMYVIAVVQDTSLRDHSSGKPKDILDNFLKFLNNYDACAEAFRKSTPSQYFGYYLPVNSPIAKVFEKGGVSFLGDTAFTIETQWTGAMAVAAKATETIEAILDEKNRDEMIGEYDRWWGRFVVNARRQFDFSTFMHSLEEEELNELFSYFSDEIVIEHLSGCDDEFGTPNEFIKNMNARLLEIDVDEIKSQKVRMLMTMLKQRAQEGKL